MVYLESLNIRPALPEDATTFAALHADSWRRNYRGAYSDAYLDGDVLSDRLAVWGERLSAPSPLCSTLVAEADDVMVGFAHTAFEESPAWGASTRQPPRGLRTSTPRHRLATTGLDRVSGSRTANGTVLVGARAELSGPGLRPTLPGVPTWNAPRSSRQVECRAG